MAETAALLKLLTLLLAWLPQSLDEPLIRIERHICKLEWEIKNICAVAVPDRQKFKLQFLWLERDWTVIDANRFRLSSSEEVHRLMEWMIMSLPK